MNALRHHQSSCKQKLDYSYICEGATSDFKSDNKFDKNNGILEIEIDEL